MIHFSIHFKTVWGQILQLTLHQLINNELTVVKVIQMQCSTDGVWTLSIDNESIKKACAYQYSVLHPDGSIINETGLARSLSNYKKETYIVDSWRGPLGNSPFNSSVFSSIFFKRQKNIAKKHPKGNLQLCIHYPKIKPNQHLAIVGNQQALGFWDVTKKVKLDDLFAPDWTVTLNTNDFRFPFEYKYLIVDSTTDSVIAWENGSNRVIYTVEKNAITCINDEYLQSNLPAWKGAGVAIPVFSLRSNKSFGVGEFEDLKLMVDWASQTGQCLIQTLPINDTTLTHTKLDSYPYNAVSVYALHPIYLNLEKIGKLANKERANYYINMRKELNAKSFVDYELVMRHKWTYFNEIFEQDADALFLKKDYTHFFEKNKDWLVPYAAFSYLRNKNKTPDTSKWKKHTTYNKAEIENLCDAKSERFKDIAIYYFLQYHLHKQLTEVHNYASSNGIAIKGDIPIGVSPLSVDVWVEPELFNTKMQAGAPPDDFSATGQNWGFPTYNWELMAQDDYGWWKKRFKKLAEYFDAYRIDHILGFFRIWEIPIKDVWGLTGHFNPALPYTKTEIEQYGINWDEERLLEPYIKEHVLWEFFGNMTALVKSLFLNQKTAHSYQFKKEFDTQRKIKAYFEVPDNGFGEKTDMVRNGLYTLHCEVLFVRDMRNSNLYHPRISIHSSANYRDLDGYQKGKINDLYVAYFYNRHNDFWKNQAYAKLPALLRSTRMLVCGEDLGMVPDTVPEVMHNLEILSLEIQRMPKNPNTEFAMPADAPYLSVCTTSTHDMNPIRAWWEENREITQRFYNNALACYGEAPKHCEQWIAEKIIEQHLSSKAMWVILPWQDWMAAEAKLCNENPEDERINVPDNPQNFWCYRMHLSLEDLLKEKTFNFKIKQMVQNSGR